MRQSIDKEGGIIITMPNPQVLIIMGSDSDLPVMQEAADVLDKFDVPWEMRI